MPQELRLNKINLNKGISATLYGLVSLVFLSSIKIIAWFFTGSVVILADALNSFADIFGMLASYIGLSWSKKPASRDFRYGYYKIENFSALIVALLTIFLGYQVFRQSFQRLFTSQIITHPLIGIIVSAISVALSFYLAKVLAVAARQINSPSLQNNAKDKLLGGFTSILVITGILANIYGWYQIEGIIGLMMCFFLFKVALADAKNSLFFLLDYWDDPVLINSIYTILRKYDKMILEVKKIRLRRSGLVIFGEIFLTINPFASIKDLRSVLANIDGEIKILNPFFKDIVLYTIVPTPKKIRVAIPILQDKGLTSEIARHFFDIKYFIFVDMVGKKIRHWKVVDFTFKEDQCHEIALYLKNNNINILIAPDLPSLVYFELASQMYFDVYPVFRNTREVESLIKLLLIDT